MDVIICTLNTDPAISINGSNVNVTLSWGELFDDLNHIVNYTVSCSSDATCPPNFPMTDNTIRDFTITNLPPATSYNFSAVATNSTGSQKQGILMITTPGEHFSCCYIPIPVMHNFMYLLQHSVYIK